MISAANMHAGTLKKLPWNRAALPLSISYFQWLIRLLNLSEINRENGGKIKSELGDWVRLLFFFFFLFIFLLTLGIDSGGSICTGTLQKFAWNRAGLALSNERFCKVATCWMGGQNGVWKRLDAQRTAAGTRVQQPQLGFSNPSGFYNTKWRLEEEEEEEEGDIQHCIIVHCYGKLKKVPGVLVASRRRTWIVMNGTRWKEDDDTRNATGSTCSPPPPPPPPLQMSPTPHFHIWLQLNSIAFILILLLEQHKTKWRQLTSEAIVPPPPPLPALPPPPPPPLQGFRKVKIHWECLAAHLCLFFFFTEKWRKFLVRSQLGIFLHLNQITESTRLESPIPPLWPFPNFSIPIESLFSFSIHSISSTLFVPKKKIEKKVENNLHLVSCRSLNYETMPPLSS